MVLLQGVSTATLSSSKMSINSNVSDMSKSSTLTKDTGSDSSQTGTLTKDISVSEMSKTGTLIKGTDVHIPDSPKTSTLTKGQGQGHKCDKKDLSKNCKCQVIFRQCKGKYRN